MDKIYKIRPEYQLKEEDAEALLFNAETGVVMLLNETGCFIFKHFNGKVSKKIIIDRMQQDFDIVDISEAERDVSEFIQLMLDEKIIEEIS